MRPYRSVILTIVVLVILFAATRPAVRAAGGTASWYDDGPGYYAAVHSWHWHDTPYRVLVTAPSGRSVVVTVRDYCGCPGGRVIDLSPAAFRQLAGQPGQGVGLIRGVTVTRLTAGATLPATDTEP